MMSKWDTIYKFPEFPSHRVESYLPNWLFLTCYNFLDLVFSSHVAFRFICGSKAQGKETAG